MAFSIVGLLVNFAISAGLTFLSYRLTRRDPLKPATVSDVQVPKTGEGYPLPIVYGTCRVDAPICTWYGDYDPPSGNTQQRISMQYVICKGEIHHFAGFYFDGKLAFFKASHELGVVFSGVGNGYLHDYKLGAAAVGDTWTITATSATTWTVVGSISGNVGTATTGVPFQGPAGPAENAKVSFTIIAGSVLFEAGDVFTFNTTSGDHKRFVFDQADLFGTDGGIVGAIDLFFGTPTQGPSDLLQGLLGIPFPGYQGICHAVFRHVYFGRSPYLKTFSPVVSCFPNGIGLTGGKHRVGPNILDANPACILYDMMTDVLDGMGISPGLIDIPSLVAMGETLYSEGLGLSFTVDRFGKAKEVVNDIQRHIEAVRYPDPQTGLLTFKLIRNDYDPETLPVLDDSVIETVIADRVSPDELKNVVRVHYIDRNDHYTKKPAQAQELALLESSGGRTIAQDEDYLMFAEPATAQKKAAEVLNGLSYELMRLSLSPNRAAWNYRPGDVVKLNWPPLGITGMIIRLGAINLGSPRDGRIQIDAVEDIFGVDWTAYAPPPATAWQDPIADTPPTLLAAAALEAPFEFVKNLPTTARAVALGAKEPSPTTTYGFRGYVQLADTTWPTSTLDGGLTPSGTLLAGIGKGDATITVAHGPDTDRIESATPAEFPAGKNVLWIADEFIAFETVTPVAGGLQLDGCVRGCLDTVPSEHALGDRAWFVSHGRNLVNVNAGANTLRMASYNPAGEEDFGDAQEVALTTSGRSERPYAPTDVEFNGEDFPAEISGELTVSWEHRNRLALWSYADAGVTAEPEDGVTYTIRVYGESDTLVHTETGLTGTSWTYPQATEEAESGTGMMNTHLRVQILAVRGSDESWQTFEWEFDRV